MPSYVPIPWSLEPVSPSSSSTCIGAGRGGSFFLLFLHPSNRQRRRAIHHLGKHPLRFLPFYLHFNSSGSHANQHGKCPLPRPAVFVEEEGTHIPPAISPRSNRRSTCGSGRRPQWCNLTDCVLSPLHFTPLRYATFLSFHFTPLHSIMLYFVSLRSFPCKADAKAWQL
ncbi:hypothetical protein Taro_038503 [Colocasia esculenta]|uniref:Uncharacterized protein n=1 Tax=Colocasia esculenta TaxID=4460 RepID=A0A843W8C1_COLES|nr:hypothetical protein [Colocasia esculenta]